MVATQPLRDQELASAVEAQTRARSAGHHELDLHSGLAARARDALDALDHIDAAVIVQPVNLRPRFTATARIARDAIDLLVEDVELAAARLPRACLPRRLPTTQLRTYVLCMGLRWVERRQGRGWIALDDEHRKVAQVDPALAGGGRRWHAQILDGSLFGVALGLFDSPEAARAAVDLRLPP